MGRLQRWKAVCCISGVARHEPSRRHLMPDPGRDRCLLLHLQPETQAALGFEIFLAHGAGFQQHVVHEFVALAWRMLEGHDVAVVHALEVLRLRA